MERRAAVKNMAFLIGGALSATTIGVFLEGCSGPSKSDGKLFSDDQQLLITEIADIIIPTTSSPGAKAAGVGPFITMMVKDCYPDDAQKAFVGGLEDLAKKSKETFNKTFLEITVAQRQQLLTELRAQTLAAAKAETEKLEEQVKAAAPTEYSILPKEKPKTEPRFFAIVRDLTLLGYFTSEIGATKAYEYIAIPGRYDGNADLKPGQRVWAT